jgi:hypothetical protein
MTTSALNSLWRYMQRLMLSLNLSEFTQKELDAAPRLAAIMNDGRTEERKTYFLTQMGCSRCRVTENTVNYASKYLCGRKTATSISLPLILTFANIAYTLQRDCYVTSHPLTPTGKSKVRYP